MSQYLSERILGAANLQVQYDVEITGLDGEQALERIRIGSRRQRKPTGRPRHGCSSPSAACPTLIGPLTPPSSEIKTAIS